MAEHHIRRLVLFYCILHFLLFELYFFFFFAFQLLQEHDLVPCSPLRSSSVSCFPAPSQLSSSMCSLVFLCLDNLEGSISEPFSLYCCQLSSLCAQSKSIELYAVFSLSIFPYCFVYQWLVVKTLKWARLCRVGQHLHQLRSGRNLTSTGQIVHSYA